MLLTLTSKFWITSCLQLTLKLYVYQQSCELQWINTVKIALMLRRGWKIALLYLIFLFFVHHGWKIAPMLYIYPSTGTENNTEPAHQERNWHRSTIIPFSCTVVNACRLFGLGGSVSKIKIFSGNNFEDFASFNSCFYHLDISPSVHTFKNTSKQYLLDIY